MASWRRQEGGINLKDQAGAQVSSYCWSLNSGAKLGSRAVGRCVGVRCGVAGGSTSLVLGSQSGGKRAWPGGGTDGRQRTLYNLPMQDSP